MKYQYVAITCFLLVFFGGCKTPTENNVPTEGRFPTIFLEAGSDSDSSYIALRTIRLQDGNLKTEATGWGVEEYGLFLNIHTESGTLTMNIMGQCGTVFSRTWVKRTFDYIVTRAAEDTLNRIRFTNFSDTLIVTKQ